MLSVRVSSPSELSHAVEALFVADPHVSSLTILRGASVQPNGDVFIADIPRERANPLVDSLRALRVHHSGTISLNPVETWISKTGLSAEGLAPGQSADAVVWAEVTERAYDESQLTWTYISFMSLATLLAAIAIVTDSIILVIGAMVLGPEFVPIAALGLAMVRKRPQLLKQALRTLVIGFAISISLVMLLALLCNVTHLVDFNEATSPRPGTDFIYHANWWSLVVAVIAGAAGVLSLTASKGNGLVGVFISVTTIPASGNIALALAYGIWNQVFGSSIQLILNITGMALAGWLTLLLQQRIWKRVTQVKVQRTQLPQADL
jgi:uncharacterized hydrophobic protein (TIGR00271 family)